MLRIHCIQGPAYFSNTYIIFQEQTSQAVIIDPGQEDISQLDAILTGKATRVPYVILTHEHFDHISGTNSVRLRYGSKIICSEVCASFIGDPKKNLSRYIKQHDILVGPHDYSIEQLDGVIQWNDSLIRLINTPGHTPGSICVGMDKSLFTGDTILESGHARCNLPGGSRLAWKQSLHLLLNEFSPDNIVYPGHGNPFPFSQVNEIYGGSQDAKKKGPDNH